MEEKKSNKVLTIAHIRANKEELENDILQQLQSCGNYVRVSMGCRYFYQGDSHKTPVWEGLTPQKITKRQLSILLSDLPSEMENVRLVLLVTLSESLKE